MLFALCIGASKVVKGQPGMIQQTDSCYYTGTVFKNISGSSGWCIDLDQGLKIDPRNSMPDEFKINGLRVKVGFDFYLMNTPDSLYGYPVYLNCIQKLNDSSCYADFTVGPDPRMIMLDSGCYSYRFIDQSSPNAVHYYWQFGDGETSTEQDPFHVYCNSGSYEVCLQIITADSCTSSHCQQITVGDTTSCSAEFGYFSLDSLMVGAPPPPSPSYTYQFYDKQHYDHNYWRWVIAGDTILNDSIPSYTFPGPGLYQACLTVKTTLGCEATYCTNIKVGNDTIAPCHAQYDYYFVSDSLPDSTAYNREVQFKDRSSGNITSWRWSFGDGTTSSQQNPLHFYANPGVYDVCLYIESSDSTCNDSICKSITVGYVSDCQANFSYCHYNFPDKDTLSSGSENLIGFKNTSKGNVFFLAWDFGDGTVSNEKNPLHNYAYSGSYRVCLTIWTYGGCTSSYCKWITVGKGCSVDFTYTIAFPSCSGFDNAYQFMPQASDSVMWYSWSFGDGGYSSEMKPAHIYESNGAYEVCLNVGYQNSCTAIKCDTVVVSDSVMIDGFVQKCGMSALKQVLNQQQMVINRSYPNPAQNALFLDISSNKSRTVSVSIRNMLGQVVGKVQNYSLVAGQNQLELNVSGFLPGRYIYEISSEDVVKHMAFSIVR